eukprot:499622_1
MTKDIWCNQPTSIEQCNVSQIEYITEQIIVNELSKLNDYKSKIIDFIKEHKMNGNKLISMKRKDFICKIAEYLKDNKLKGSLGTLRKSIIHFNLPIFPSILRTETISVDSIKPSNKFETTMTLEKENDAYYYSFGTQYRYTQNLQQHPFYVQSKYATLKEELLAYFDSIQKKQVDSAVLIEAQLNTIEYMDVHLRPILRVIANLPSVINTASETTGITRQHISSIFEVLKMEDKMFQKLITIITELLDMHSGYYKENVIMDIKDDGKYNKMDDDQNQRHSIKNTISQAYSILTQSFEAQMAIIEQKITKSVEEYFTINTEYNATEYLSKITTYMEKDSDEQSTTPINIANDIMSAIEFLGMHGNDKLNFRSDLVEPAVKRMIPWIKTYIRSFEKMEEKQRQSAEIVVDVFNEILRTQKYVFYTQHLETDDDFHDIFKHIFGTDFNELESPGIIKPQLLQSTIQQIQDTLERNAAAAKNKIVDIIETDALSMLTQVQSKRCCELVALGDLKNYTGIIHIIPILINLLQIILAKINELNKMYLLKLNEIEQKACEITTKIQKQSDAAFLKQYTNVVFTHFFNALLDTYVSRVRIPALSKKTFREYWNNLDEQEINHYVINMKKFVQQTNHIINLYEEAFQDDVKLEMSLSSKQYIHYIIEQKAKSITQNPFICNDSPDGLFQYNTEHIAWIMNNDILKKTSRNLLMPHKTKIIEYVKTNEWNGYKLKKLGRKNFMNQIAKCLKNSNLKPLLGTLYQAIMQYHHKSNKEILCNIFLNILNETVAVKMQHFVKFISPKLSKYPAWMNNKQVKATKIKQAYNAHRIQIMSEIFNIHFLKQCISSFHSSNFQNETELLQKIIVSASCSEVLWVCDAEDDVDKVDKIIQKSSKQLRLIIKKLCGSLDDQQRVIHFVPEELPLNKQQMKFVMFAVQKIKEKLKLNETSYVVSQPEIRSLPFIEKAVQKTKMYSVRRLKASWYQGMNEHHRIIAKQQLTNEHVLAAVLYTDISTLCTKFRETYRKIYNDETLQQQITRHSQFANFGRLLYEAFVFYGTTDDRVAILYHGMSIELLFKSLFCIFDAPTSTTTAQSVACNFGGGGGIVMKLQSCESTQYIKTFDMDLFSCFDHEEEHLIFETRLHIKDIFLQKTRQWIGKRLMHSFSLYDLLIHGNVIRNKHLLKPKSQQLLLEMIQCVMKEQTSTYTQSDYANKMIKSLFEQNNKIWLNIQQIKSLANNNLQNMFIAKDGEQFGEFIIFLKKHFNIIICPIFITNWTMNHHAFDIISRSANKKHSDVQVVVAGPPIKCNLSDNKTIVFQPTLTKIEVENVFDVKLKFISTHKKLPIKVHFDVNYEDTDRHYYKSLHP